MLLEEEQKTFILCDSENYVITNISIDLYINSKIKLIKLNNKYYDKNNNNMNMK
jgi:hypothetical protein